MLLKKYGWENFKHEILAKDLTLNEAIRLEIYYIQQYDSTNRMKGYNVSPGGYSNPVGPENKLFGRKRPLEVIQKIAEKRRGIPWSDTMRRKRELYHATHKSPTFGTKASPETREKLRISHLGQCRPHTNETILKIRASQKNSIPVQKFSLNGLFISEFSSISEAARSIGDKNSIKENIRQCCEGKRKTAYGFVWKKVNDVV